MTRYNLTSNYIYILWYIYIPHPQVAIQLNEF